ncbi:MAG TPA: ATP-binding protein [Candidatus Angelobacter sp.]|jgi:PAS domain S-box-containing protein|nr:ATP-binding protein [Candidatus Angelobacter sp.]
MAGLKTTAGLEDKLNMQKPNGLKIVKGQQRETLDRTATPEFTSAQEALRDSEARYRRLFETAQDGILILDAKTGLITDVNPFLVKLLDYSREEFLGKALWDIGPFKDIEASKTAFRELQAKQYVRYEDLPLKTRGGRSVNVEFVSNVYGVNGKKVIQCNVRDITRRKYAEQSEQQMRQAQKMEALGQLAGGVAHDFNNLLGVILGYCEILEKRLDLDEPTRNMIVKIHNAGTCAKDLTRHLLAFGRRQVLLPVFLDLNTTVNQIETMLSRLIGDDVELVSVLGGGLGTIRADPSQVEQVLMNLAVNARDAMPQGGKITIETANVEIDEIHARRHLSIKPGPYVVLTVSDTGIGMDKETQSHIFEPFFSTKEAGKGTGLGLSTVFGIVKQSDGAISVTSAPGHGTTFKIHFPRCEEAPALIQPEKTMPLRGGSETILLVEDAGPLRELTRRLLEDCGYTVLDAGTPAEAIRIAEQHKDLLPLMITDVVMPGLSGPVLAERLSATRPETRVLYTSGYADQAGDLGPECTFLEKPFTRDALVKKVRELLDSPIGSTL